MKLTVKNLGPIKEGTFDLSKDLIVFTGDNNTGKTYALSLLFSINVNLNGVSFSKERIRINQSRINLSDIISHLNYLLEMVLQNSTILETLHYDLALTKGVLENCKIQLEFVNDEVLQIIERTINNPIRFDNNEYYVKSYDGSFEIIDSDTNSTPEELQHKIWDKYLMDLTFNTIHKNIYSSNIHIADRGAITLFSNDILRSQIANPKFVDSNGIMTIENSIYQYGIAIRTAIVEASQFHSNATIPANIQKQAVKKLVEELQIQFIEGEVLYDEKNDKVVLLNDGIEIPLRGSSSSIRSISNIIYTLKKNIASAKLFIDEPELNLHPSRQSLFSQIITHSVSKGYKFVITTHSDYIIREINILCQMFQNRDKLNLANFPEYTEDMLIDPKRVGMYYFDKTDGIVKELAFDKETGFIIPSMDAEIERQNDTINKIYTYAFD